ncbi:ArsR family transcriptional regulator [Haloprofundus sp. MHR1]|uniref:DUF7344 domain-containing protein n=1 Tax=Haloprofundus sp. MHR1 TaxID=2572921 RepID=UPI0010BE29F6|nr:ArsR family transcriptional regulator [Haloprofundus sp. MHR1]QCJ47132.1 ArsR family transcriptional regulator [Haloprofundus sp. MHR1]
MNGPTATNSPEATELDADEWNELFDALAVDRRRTVLLELVERGAPLSVDALAEAVFERHGPGADAPHAESTAGIECLRIELYHVDLPKLAAADLVAFDEETQRASATERTAASAELLDGLR